MTLADLRARIEAEASLRVLPALIEKAADAHRKHWRSCDCQWCALKQQATAVIANVRCGDPERRADLRFHLANEFRAKLRERFGE